MTVAAVDIFRAARRIVSATTANIVAQARVRRQSDGKYILGVSDESNNIDFVTARYNNNGTPDASFGNNGYVETSFNAGADTVYAMLRQADGKIVLAGSAFATGSQGNLNYFALARYNVGTIAPAVRPQVDFDGDGKADVSVFRASSGTRYLQQSQAGFTGAAFGVSTDKLVPADYDGDGKADVAVFRNGSWYNQRLAAGFTGFAFGAATDEAISSAYVR